VSTLRAGGRTDQDDSENWPRTAGPFVLVKIFAHSWVFKSVFVGHGFPQHRICGFHIKVACTES
jgi:hypothetical protein